MYQPCSPASNSLGLVLHKISLLGSNDTSLAQKKVTRSLIVVQFMSSKLEYVTNNQNQSPIFIILHQKGV